MSDMPQSVKDELSMLHECMQMEKERYMNAIKPYMDRIYFIHNCYPSPMVVDREIIEKFMLGNEPSGKKGQGDD